MIEPSSLRRLFDAMDDALCIIEILDVDDESRVTRVRYLHANPAFERHTGYPGIEGTTSDVAFPDLEPQWFEHISRAWRTGEASHFTDEAPSLGRTYQMSLSRIGCKNTRQVCCLFRDVTVRADAERRVVQLVAELSDADRRKTEFLATLAHELRNPLSPIRNGLELTESIEGMPAEAVELNAMMSRQVEQLSCLVDELLDLSRISQGKLTLRRGRAALVDIVEDAVQSCRPMLEAQGHALVVDVAMADTQVDVDPVRFTQVLSNLLGNAVRYTPRGGHIALGARVDERGVHLSVSDDGKGLDAEDLSRIFELFTQIRDETPREHGGLGIGLTLSRRIVELHGGELTVSSPGRGLGSRFDVHIPQGAPSELAPDPSVPTASPPGRASTILIVDDNRDAADTLAMILRLRGHDAHVAYDGRAALEAVGTLRPEFVLLDIGLPDITGYEVALELARHDYRNELSLIALTGWGMESDRQLSAEAGFDHHLTKPVSGRAVLELVSRIIASRGAVERSRCEPSSE